MEWYYAENKQQKGPVSETEFEELLRAGRIRGKSLVWHEGMSAWRPWGEISSAEASLGNVIPGDRSCGECGGYFAREEMLSFGESWVCASCKPLVVQKIKEGVPLALSMEYASFGIRLVAYIIDYVFTQIVLLPITIFFSLSPIDATNPASILIYIILYIVLLAAPVLYDGLFVGRFAATPGKMIVGIKVVTADGERVSWPRSFGRAGAEILSSMICMIGYMLALFDEEKRTLHDHICNTRVVMR